MDRPIQLGEDVCARKRYRGADGSEAAVFHECASISYRRRAAECRQRAVLSPDVAGRLNYLQLADYWSDMARDAEYHDRIRGRRCGAAA